MPKKYFGTDGIRGEVGIPPITAEFMLKFGWAVGKVLGDAKGGNILVGKDTRISGYMFESALVAGLAAAGVNAKLLGPLPTPAIAFLTNKLQANAGIVISASHNPHSDNGIKLFSSLGYKLADEKEIEIEEMIETDIHTVESNYVGNARRINDAGEQYVDFCKSTLPRDFNLAGLKIILDCANGATYKIGPRLFEDLGCDLEIIGNAPDGFNINKGVGATKLQKLISTVIEKKADLGVALDGDGDRVIMVDQNGVVRDGDDILYILAKSKKRQKIFTGNLVGTLMTNLGLEIALRDMDIRLTRTQVGDRYIFECLQEKNWSLGGEPSGHIICLDKTTTGDGLIAALQVLCEIQNSNKNLGDLCLGLRKFPQKLINVEMESHLVKKHMSSNDVKDTITSAEADLGDEGRILIRPSGTEPLVRVMVEGKDIDKVEKNAQAIANALLARL